MNQESPSEILNDNQKRALATTFRHIDSLLVDIQNVLASSESGTPFPKHVHDLGPTEHQVLGDYLSKLRAQMVEGLSRLRTHIDEKRVSARWSIQVTLTFISVALAEIAPQRLAGYGALGPEGQAEVGRVLADIERTVEKLRAYVAQGLGRDLAARLARLESASPDVAALREIERIVRQRGLIEFRGMVESVIERAESETFEIAVFGRVSSGKSSLLNTILEIAALPVGVTPVTAVPTRISWAEIPKAKISLAEEPERGVELGELAEFVSEAGNPGNRKRVVRASVGVPSPKLRKGIVFVDTPGVGSLAATGARESYAYLPRCDLGIVLVDAGGAAEPSDFELLRLLYESGVPAMLLVSKADLLSPADRERMRGYVTEEVKKRLGLRLSVSLVSSVADGGDSAKRWFDSEILPLFQQARELRDKSIRRKIGHLAESIAAVLQTRVVSEGGVPGATAEKHARIEDSAAEAERCVQGARSRIEKIVDNSKHEAVLSLLEAAEELAREVAASKAAPSDPAQVVRTCVLRRAAAMADDVTGSLLSARDQLRRILGQMGKELSFPHRPEEIEADLLGRPSIELPADLNRRSVLPGFRISKWFQPVLRKRMESKLRANLEAVLTATFSSVAFALRDWAGRSLSRLADQFATGAEPLRTLARPTTGQEGRREGGESLLSDIQLLNQMIATQR